MPAGSREKLPRHPHFHKDFFMDSARLDSQRPFSGHWRKGWNP